MFKHQVKMQLRADSFILLSQKIDNTIMPLLRLQKGFNNGVTSVMPERSSATEDTFWNTKEDAEEYQRSGYLKVLETLAEVVSATPSSVISEVPA